MLIVNVLSIFRKQPTEAYFKSSRNSVQKDLSVTKTILVPSEISNLTEVRGTI